MINRDDLTPEQQEIWDKSYLGQVAKLEAAVLELKRAIYDALPKWLHKFITRP